MAVSLSPWHGLALLQQVVGAAPHSASALRPDDISTLGERIAAICPESQLPASKLEQLENTLSGTLSKDTNPAPDHDAVLLACVRATGMVRGLKAQVGYLMPLGTRLLDGAMRVLVPVASRHPGNRDAARLLAALSVLAVRVDSIVLLADGARQTGVPPGKLANIMFASARAGVTDSGVYRACTSLLLEAGDSTTARECSSRALERGLDSTWHLVRLAYLASRAQEPARSLEYFRESAFDAQDASGRGEVAWQLDLRRGPVSRKRGETFVMSALSATERAEWMSLADPAARLAWLDHRIAAAAKVSRMSGVEVLYHHFDGLAPARGSLFGCTLSYAFVLLTPGNPIDPNGTEVHPTIPVSCFPTLDPDITLIPTAIRRYRLWDERGSPVSVVTYAISNLASVASAGPAELDFREYRQPEHAWFDTTIAELEPAEPRDSPSATRGLFLVPRLNGAADWSVTVVQGDNRRAVVADSDRPLDDGELIVSDVVLGDPTQHLAWRRSDGDSVIFAPLGTVDRRNVLEAFAQVRSSAPRPATTTLSVFRVEHGERQPRATIAIGGHAPLGAGVSSWHERLDLSRLRPGTYDIELVVAAGADQSTGRTRVTIR